jgi:hypothetical protein
VKNQRSKRLLRLSVLALLLPISISLVGCDEATQSGVDTQEPEITRNPPEPEPSSTPSPQSPTPFPDFYGTGLGGKYYGN